MSLCFVLLVVHLDWAKLMLSLYFVSLCFVLHVVHFLSLFFLHFFFVGNSPESLFLFVDSVTLLSCSFWFLFTLSTVLCVV